MADTADTTGRPPGADTALVLGAGGLTGVGWEIGMLHGLAESGVDLSTADLVVGSSAGAMVGAQLLSGRMSLGELYARQLAAPPGGGAAGGITPGLFIRYARAVLGSHSPEEYGRRLGRIALDALEKGRTPTPEERREVIAERLLSDEWPARPLRVTAVDALTGALRAFDRASGVPVVDAVAASCAVPGHWPPVTLAGRAWIDGGVHSAANAHLATGYHRVVVLAPSTLGNKVVVSPAAQAAELSANGARTCVVMPSAAARKAFGRNSLDPAARASAARAGREQAAAEARSVAAVWQP
ncbi:patatin-like phospholipase family protein [Streptomyces sp. CA-294286]|uniref:patatin-like phospholipase family protein n=1 Tax=Streptomyces sp. CA-294286 TaxID=3240070 RepID=UPI003D8E0CA1